MSDRNKLSVLISYLNGSTFRHRVGGPGLVPDAYAAWAALADEALQSGDERRAAEMIDLAYASADLMHGRSRDGTGDTEEIADPDAE